MNEADRLRAKFALALGRTASVTACPPLEHIVAWQEKSLDAVQAQAMQSHVANCAHCCALWSGLLELEPAPATAAAASTRKVRWWHFAAPALALSVVAVTLWIGLLSGAPLPAYSLDIRGGLDVRGGQESSLMLRDQTLLRILVTPASAVDEQIEAAAYSVSPRGLTALPVKQTVTDQGVASLEAVVGQDIVIAPDTQRVLIVVGRRGQLPDSETLRRTLGDKTQVTRDDWQAFAVNVDQG